MKIIQGIFCLVLNLIYGITGHMSEKSRNLCLGTSLLAEILLVYIYIMKKELGLEVTSLANMWIHFGLLCLIIIFSVDRKMTVHKVNFTFVIFWVATFVLALIAGLSHDTGDGMVVQIIILGLLIPLLAFVWNNRGDFKWLYTTFAKIFSSVMAVAFIICLMVKPIEIIDGLYRYYGFTENPNMLGCFCLVGIVSAVYLLFTEKEFKPLYFVALGMNFGMLYYSMSRTSLIAAIFAIIVGIIIYIKQNFLFEKSGARGMVTIIIMIVVLMISPIMVYTAVNGVYEVTTQVFAEDETGDEQDVYDEIMKSRFSIAGKDFNSLTSGRYNIWQVYMGQLNFAGNDVNDRFYITGDRLNYGAHNMYIEYGYRFGVPAGITWLVFALLSLVYVVIRLFRKIRIRGYEYFSIMIICGFILVSGFESLTYAMMNPVSYMYALGAMPLFALSGKEPREKKGVLEAAKADVTGKVRKSRGKGKHGKK